MKENQSDQRPTGSPSGQQNQGSQNSSQRNTGNSSPESPSPVEDSDEKNESSEKERQGREHKHDSQTPVATQTENRTGDANKNQSSVPRVEQKS